MPARVRPGGRVTGRSPYARRMTQSADTGSTDWTPRTARSSRSRARPGPATACRRGRRYGTRRDVPTSPAPWSWPRCKLSALRTAVAMAVASGATSLEAAAVVTEAGERRRTRTAPRCGTSVAPGPRCWSPACGTARSARRSRRADGADGRSRADDRIRAVTARAAGPVRPRSGAASGRRGGHRGSGRMGAMSVRTPPSLLRDRAPRRLRLLRRPPNAGKSTLTNALVGTEGGHHLQPAADHPPHRARHRAPARGAAGPRRHPGPAQAAHAARRAPQRRRARPPGPRSMSSASACPPTRSSAPATASSSRNSPGSRRPRRSPSSPRPTWSTPRRSPSS